MDVPSSWDALNKQARKLEAQLDEQMHSYRKLVSTKGSTKVAAEENDLESGVDWLLKQLQQIGYHLDDVCNGFTYFDSSSGNSLRSYIDRLYVISQAQSTLGALVFQWSTFGSIDSKLGNVSSSLRSLWILVIVVNQILSSIKRKESTDTIILSLVASVCMFLIFSIG